MSEKRELNEEELIKFAADAESHFMEYIIGKYGPAELLEEGNVNGDKIYEFAAHTFIESYLNGDSPKEAAVKAAKALGVNEDESKVYNS